MGDLILGIDLGTTSVKAAVLKPGGQVVAQYAQSYATDRRIPGQVEQDAMAWLTVVGHALAQCAAACGEATVDAAGLCSQVNTHVFVDTAGLPLIPAIVWQDTRAGAEAAELESRLTVQQKIAALGAPIPIDASHVLARMLWVQRNRPEIWDQTAHVLLPKDFVHLRLTGTLVTDPLANVGVVGPDLRYADALLSLVPGAAERMAPLAGVAEVVGALAPPFDGVPLINGTMDGWVGLIGGGAVREGAGVYLSGTSEILGAVASTVTNEPGIVVFPEAAGLRLHAGPTQSGGASAAWFSETFGIPLAEMQALVQASPRRTGAPMFLPQLAGERAPLWNPGLRGAFLGVDSGATRGDLARAVYEGVAFSARHVWDGIEASADIQPDTLYCGGGGFGSASWAQIRADVLGKRLKLLRFSEPGILGAVCLAASNKLGLDRAHDLYAAYADEVLPDPLTRPRYDELFGVYKDAITATEGIHTRNMKI